MPSFFSGICHCLLVAIVMASGFSGSVSAQDVSGLHAGIDSVVETIEEKVIGWRRDFHEHPELSNREFRTAGIVAEHLSSLGIAIRTNVAHTGVVGVLKGGKPGGVVALRADMDALPITEKTGLPFASTLKSEYNGTEVGVMHACGHDMHTAILMGAAETLAGLRDESPAQLSFFSSLRKKGRRGVNGAVPGS